MKYEITGVIKAGRLIENKGKLYPNIELGGDGSIFHQTPKQKKASGFQFTLLQGDFTFMAPPDFYNECSKHFTQDNPPKVKITVELIEDSKSHTPIEHKVVSTN